MTLDTQLPSHLEPIVSQKDTKFWNAFWDSYKRAYPLPKDSDVHADFSTFSFWAGNKEREEEDRRLNQGAQGYILCHEQRLVPCRFEAYENYLASLGRNDFNTYRDDETKRFIFQLRVDKNQEGRLKGAHIPHNLFQRDAGGIFEPRASNELYVHELDNIDLNRCVFISPYQLRITDESGTEEKGFIFYWINQGDSLCSEKRFYVERKSVRGEPFAVLEDNYKLFQETGRTGPLTWYQPKFSEVIDRYDRFLGDQRHKRMRRKME